MNKRNLISFAQSGRYMPKEEMLEVQKNKQCLTIGIPKEIAFQENRIALIPEAVALLVANGHTILIESKAGEAAFFLDTEYTSVGGQIVYSPEEVYKADVILKVAPLSDKEIGLLRPQQCVISAIQLPAQNADFFTKLSQKKVTAISYEYIKDKTKIFPIRRAMSEIVGNTAIMIAGEYLSSCQYGRGIMLGGVSGITPTEVVILGAGTVGEFATATALGMGATVKVFDNSIYKLRRLQYSVNQKVFTSILDSHMLERALKTAHVAIGAIYAPEGKTPCVITEEMVSQMRKGAVIVDVSIDQGGCFETSRVTNHNNPVFIKHDVTHYCVPNIASRVPRTASYALSNFFAPVLVEIGEAGGIEHMLAANAGIRKGVYLYNGVLTSKLIGDFFKLPFKDIELLMAAF